VLRSVGRMLVAEGPRFIAGPKRCACTALTETMEVGRGGMWYFGGGASRGAGPRGGRRDGGMEMQGNGFCLRPWRYGDEPSLVRYANNRRIWLNLTDQ